MKNFTDLSIRSLPLGTHFDPKQPGFAIRIGKNRKTWLAVKGPRDKRVQVIMGYYPEIPLAQARKRAQLELATPSRPGPPITFPEALNLFLAQNKWRLRSKKVLESSLRHFSWSRPLYKITHEDVATALDAIKNPSAKAHALKDIRSFFNWSVPRYLQLKKERMSLSA